ncbi:MAG: riboflavin synthase [Kiritimatiellae bacterium]|jgi:riboflavin synthase|nr:riboflavin synthase [Kiritimatiellia bacterium]
MFTGLIEKQGIIKGITKRGEGYLIDIEHTAWDEELKSGESVAVCGACLTATNISSTSFSADMLLETASLTTLVNKSIGDVVNLERAMAANGRFGGHFVTGHVDGVGEISEVKSLSNDYVVTIEAAKNLLDGIVLKGSITIEGISLTIARVDSKSFDVHIIPTTWRETNLSVIGKGGKVNLETDMIGKYVKQFMDKRTDESSSSISMDTLHKAGF